MKKIVTAVLALSMITTVSLMAKGVNLSNEELLQAYELGHYHGINQLEREFKQSMNGVSKIQFKNYMVGIDVSDIPAHKIFLLKNYGYLEGVNPVTLTNNMLIFNSYERKADALYLMEILNKNYKLDKADKHVDIIVNEDLSKEYDKAPFIYRSLFENMMEKIKEDVKAKVYVVEPISRVKEAEMPTRIMSRKPETTNDRSSSKAIVERIEKNETSLAQTKTKKEQSVQSEKQRAFTPKYESITALTYDAPLESFTSKNWKESLFKDANVKIKKGEKMMFANMVKTDSGVKYIKVLDKNLWVDAEDVSIIGGKN